MTGGAGEAKGPGEGDGEGPERLMGFALADDDPDRFDLFNVRVLSAAESRKSKAAMALLSFVSDQNPLVGLERAHARWATACEYFEEVTDLAAKPTAAQDVQDAFDAWLTACRGVDYFTKAWIGGRDDAEALRKRFELFASEEFDANAAYRACVALRNVAQHAGKTINALTYGTATGPNGELEHYVDLSVDMHKLVASHGRWLSAARRQEFDAVGPLLSVELLVGFATQACVRMFYRLVDAVGPEVEAACVMVAEHHREAVAVGGTSAAFATNAEGFARLESGIELRNNGHEQLALVHGLLPDITRAVAAPVLVSWDDLVAP
jgi:hypothetical protein